MYSIRFAIVTIFLIQVSLASPAQSSEALFIDAKGDATFSGNATVKGTIRGIGITPPGGIIMFSGDVGKAFDANGTGFPNTPYEGWQLCNGNNNSPDLRDRFVAAAGGKYQVGTQGGSDSVTLALDQIPAHNHGGRTGGQNLNLNYPGVFWNSKGVSTGILVSVQQPSPRNRPNLLTTRNQPPIQILPANHSHVINTQGGGQPHENRPRFYALAFIMRLPPK
jgi:microcystin-dependent protein